MKLWFKAKLADLQGPSLFIPTELNTFYTLYTVVFQTLISLLDPWLPEAKAKSHLSFYFTVPSLKLCIL